VEGLVSNAAILLHAIDTLQVTSPSLHSQALQNRVVSAMWSRARKDSGLAGSCPFLVVDQITLCETLSDVTDFVPGDVASIIVAAGQAAVLRGHEIHEYRMACNAHHVKDTVGAIIRPCSVLLNG
jgi:hypothetical protein